MHPAKRDNIDDDGVKYGTKADGMDGEGEHGEDGESPHVDAAHEVLDAVKAGDAEALSEALKVFYDLCKEEHEDGEDGEY